MIYREYPLPGRARGAAFCAWRFSFEPRDGERAEHRIPPDGTTNVVVVLPHDGSRLARLVGPTIAARQIPVMRGWAYAGLRLRPEAAASVTGCATAVGASDPCRPHGRLAPILDALAMLAADGENWDSRGIGDALSGLSGIDRGVTPAIDRLVSSGGRTSLSALAAQAGLCARQFRRRFREATGLAPKQYAAVQRLRRAITLALDDSRWAQVAAEAGFADQPHLARALKHRFGASAGDVLAYLGGISHILLPPEDVRFVQDEEPTSG